MEEYEECALTPPDPTIQFVLEQVNFFVAGNLFWKITGDFSQNSFPHFTYLFALHKCCNELL